MPDVKLIGPDGSLYEMPSEEAADAVANDGFRIPKNVRLYGPDGGAYDIPEHEADTAIKEHGFVTESEAKYGDQKARTFAEGAARGASLGLSDAIQSYGAGIGTALGNVVADITGIGETQRRVGREINAPVVPMDRSGQAAQAWEESKRDISGRREANPISATSGEISGIIPTSLATGALGTAKLGSGAARIGAEALGSAKSILGSTAATTAERSAAQGAILAAAKKSIATSAVELGVAGGAEGAIYGTAKELNDAYLAGDYGQLAEKAWSGALKGGSAGMIMAPLVVGGMSLAGKGLNKILNRGVKDVSESLSDSAVDSRLHVENALENQMETTSALDTALDSDIAATMETIMEPVYMARGSVMSRDLAEHQIANAQRLFAQSRAAHGGFEEAQQAGVKNIGDDYEKLMKGVKRLDRFAGLAAKRRNAIEMDSPLPPRAKSFFDDARAAIDEFADSAVDDVDVATAAKVRSIIDKAEKSAVDSYDGGQSGLSSLDDIQIGLSNVFDADNARSASFISKLSDSVAEESASPDLWSGELRSLQVPDEVSAVFSTLRGRISSLVDELSEEALKDRGGLGAIKRLKSRISSAEEHVAGMFQKGRRGTAAMALDDLKRSIGEAHSSKNKYVRQLVEGETGYDGLYGVVQRGLEDQALWGNFAVKQKSVNPFWSERIRRGMDQQIQRFSIDRSGELGASPWETGVLPNREAIGSFLNRVGDEEMMGIERAFRLHLRSMEADALARAKAWGTDELREEAKRISKYVSSIEERINAVALSRSNKQKWEKLTRDIGELPVVGTALKSSLNISSKAAAKTRLATSSSLKTTASTSAESAVSAHRRASAIPAKFASFISNPKLQQAASTGAIKIRVEQALNEARALQDQYSPQATAAREYLQDLADDNPQMAQAMAEHLDRRSQFILRKQDEHRGDPSTIRRYAYAVVDPMGALERVSSGKHSEQDIETLQQVYPSLWSEFVSGTMQELDDDHASYDTRVRASIVLGVPLEPSMSPENISFSQSRMGLPTQAQSSVDMGAQTAPLTGDRIAFERAQ